MTGLLPHTHGMLWVHHCVDEDQGRLRTRFPHWAQRLADCGYETGYFGKWHVEHSESPGDFGWHADGSKKNELFREYARKVRRREEGPEDFSLVRYNDRPEGYRTTVHYAVSDYPVEYRGEALVTDLASDFISRAEEPWCCFASCQEPHDPFVCSRESFELYDVDDIPVPPNWNDDLAGRPGLYRKTARVFKDMTERQRKEAAACYYARITDVDRQFGRLIDQLEDSGRMDNTIVVLTSDHGELLGAHGMYCKNFSAFEEVYHVPMLLSGPGIRRGASSEARVGLHDVGPTLLDLAGAEPLGEAHGRSFAEVLRDPDIADESCERGFAEYFGTRYLLTQRVFWDGPWKLVLNGFDFDELYDLEQDPYEIKNLIDDPGCREQIKDMMKQVHRLMLETGEDSIIGANYPALRIEPFGPQILDESA